MIDISEDPVLFLRALGEMSIALLAMHMEPQALARAAAGFRALADSQDAATASGVAVHPSNRDHDPALARLMGDLYDAARTSALSKMSGVPAPSPFHDHRIVDGRARPPT